jgi:hypothetical protein
VDGGRPRIETVIGQRLVDGHDLVLEPIGDPGRGDTHMPSNYALRMSATSGRISSDG